MSESEMTRATGCHLDCSFRAFELKALPWDFSQDEVNYWVPWLKPDDQVILALHT